MTESIPRKTLPDNPNGNLSRERRFFSVLLPAEGNLTPGQEMLFVSRAPGVGTTHGRLVEAYTYPSFDAVDDGLLMLTRGQPANEVRAQVEELALLHPEKINLSAPWLIAIFERKEQQ